jgi:hypothetical protein
MQIKDVLSFIENEAANPLVITTASEVAAMLGFENPTPAINAIVSAVKTVQEANAAITLAVDVSKKI